ncbi:MAG: YbgC/FadM family acyl-CoA thioesterase [Burkholderiales bacterium]|nr:YbgC/FadM family acyl-CoA thioesterase [Burkholderiales bacterium]
MKRSDFRCLHRMRVRWAEVDMQKIVFNVHYLMYFDTAMADYWRALALPYESSMHQLGGDTYVKKATVEYFASARYDDQLTVGLRCGRVGSSSIRFDGAIFRGETLLVTGELLYVFADPATQRSRPVPEALRDLFLVYEAGQPVVTLETGDWNTLQSSVAALRQSVFVEEQGIDAVLVWDASDASAVHAVLTNRLGLPVASGRLVQQAPGVGRIGRMAVHRLLRGASLGRDVLDALLAAARQRGDTEVMLHAQCEAEGFYRRLGFTARGDVFQEAGLDHIEMVRVL